MRSARYDYVVVGAGSSGCAITRRLVDANASVALIEAGGSDDNPAIHDPGRWPELMNAGSDWAFATDPQEACEGRRISWPRGKVLGGTSTMNGMVFIRGHRLDFDGWAYHGCPGWSYADVLPLFKRLEDFDGGPSETRGTGGPVAVMSRYEPHPLLASLVGAVQEAGLPLNPDHNSGELDGVAFGQLTIRDGKRQTAWVAYLQPVRDRPNLRVYTGAQARRLRFAGTRCIGVEIKDDAGDAVIEAEREVLLCAGAIGSPKLLLLSGIGPAEELSALGIDVLVDLPGVGKNLHDHVIAPVIVSSPKPVPPRRPGLSQHHAHWFWRSRPGLVVPDTQPVCFHFPLYWEPWMEGPEHGYTIVGGLIRPESRGALRLRSADPDAPLSLDPRLLTCDADLEALAASVEQCREVARQPALAEWTKEELYPGPSVRTREDVRTYVRRTIASYHHQAGTCKMGSDELSVVDPELRVYGVDGLRVADASVMPFITTGNTNAPAFMIGEKASDLLLAAA